MIFVLCISYVAGRVGQALRIGSGAFYQFLAGSRA